MRVYSVMPQLQGINNAVKNQKDKNSINVSNASSMSNASYVSSVNLHPSQNLNSSVVKISFTGNKDKNIDQFASYAPENKRFGVQAWDQGGLGVVSYEGPVSWRRKEKGDVRDFVPYHSHDNDTGGIKVAILTPDASGKIPDKLDPRAFVTATSDDTLDTIAQKYNLKKENLSYVVQLKPDDNGYSKYLKLEDSGVKGSFQRVSDEAVDQLQTIKYRLFRSLDNPDTIELDIKKIQDGVRKKIEKATEKEIKDNITKTHTKAMTEAIAKDTKNKNNKAVTALNEKIAAKVTEAMKDEKIQAKINSLYETELSSKPITDKIAKINSTAAAAAKERNAAYLVHTEGLAKMSNAYGSSGAYGTYGTYGAYGAYGAYGGNVTSNTHYGDNCRAFAELLPQLNTPEHGNYNPANMWLHCRPSFLVMSAVSDLSADGKDYYNGMKVHGTFHNPGRNYQGTTNNPFEFFRMVATAKDVEELKNHKQINLLKRIEQNWANADATQRNIASQILKPFMEGYVDDFGTYNVTMTPINAVTKNPNNMSAGSVSMYYGNEMKDPNTAQIADGLTKSLSKIKTINITNGSTPANLRLNDPEANFHRNGESPNLLTKNKGGFKTYNYEAVFDESGKVISSNIDEVVKAKEQNTKWFIDLMGNAYEKGGKNGLSKVFFSDNQIGKGNSVLGQMSAYKKGDILIMGWGRPDPQKGYPSTLEAFLNFLKSDAPDSVKQKTKLILGAGVWGEGGKPDDWKHINDTMKAIAEHDGGKYKGNAVYVNGFFPNRLVGCATFSMFSSRFEPCGITPLESFASGTPVISTKTGGAPDFIKRSRGYLTENPFLLNPEKLKTPLNFDFAGKTNEEIDTINETIDNARIKQNADELTKCIKDAVYDYSDEYKKFVDDGVKNGTITEKFNRVSYKSMIEDAITQKVDWHENAEYNGGKSANTRYMEEVFERSKGMEGRDKNPLKRLVGKFGLALDKDGNVITDSITKTKSKIGKILLGVGAGIALLGSGFYWYSKKRKDSAAPQDAKIPVAKLDKPDNKTEDQNKTKEPTKVA